MKKVIILLLLVIIIVTIGCDDKTRKNSEQIDDQSLEQTFNLGGAPIEVKVRLSKAILSLTEFLIIRIQLDYQEGVKPIPLLISPNIYSPLILVEKPKHDEKWLKEKKYIHQEWHFKFEPFNSGKFTLKPFDVYFRLEKERTNDLSKWPVYKITTTPIEYEIKPTEIDPNDELTEIRGFILPPFEWNPLILASISSLLLFLIYFGVKVYISRGKEPETAVELPDYYKIALESLDQLNVDALIDKQKIEQIHVELSAILRSYLENFFQLKAKEQTTEEFVREISFSSQFTGEQRNLLQQFLRLADLVKFATFEPDDEGSRNAFKSVKNFVINTGKKNGT